MKCNNCGWRLDAKRDIYCPYCGKAVKELSISIPNRIFSEIPFEIKFQVSGEYIFTLSKIVIDSKVVYKGPLNISERQPVVRYVAYPNDSMYSNEVLVEFIFEGGYKKTLKTIVEEKPNLPLQIQKIQEIDFSEEKKPIVYLSNYYDDLYVLPKSNISISALQFKIADKLFKFENRGEAFIIQGNLWKSLKEKIIDHEKGIEGEIVIISSEHKFKYSVITTFVLVNLPKLNIRGIESRLNNFLMLKSNQSISFKIEANRDENTATDLIDVQVSTLTDSTSISNPGPVLLDNLQSENRLIFSQISDSDLIDIAGGKTKVFRVRLRVNQRIIPDNKILSIIKEYDFLIKDDENLRELPYIVIDFGTSNSCVAYGENPQELELLADEHDEKNLTELQTTITFKHIVKDSFNAPSIIDYFVYWDKKNTILGYADNFKIQLEEDSTRLYRDNNEKSVAISPSGLIELYLKEVIRRLADKGFKTEKVLMTFPAAELNNFKEKLFNVAKNAGFKIHKSSKLTEPEAIAIFYINSIFTENRYPDIKENLDPTSEKLLGVYDCGGGTTDISIVKINFDKQEMEILATWGTNKFCGNYITFLMVKNEYQDREIPNNFHDVLNMTDFENQKKYLELAIGMESVKKDKERNDKNLKKLLQEPIIKSFGKIDEILSKLYLLDMIEKTDLDILVLAGNSVKLEIFYDIAKDKFKNTKVIYDKKHLKDAVVRGAFLYAHSYDGNIKVKGLNRNRKSYYYQKLNGFIPKIETISPPWTESDREIFSEKISHRVSPRKDFIIYRLDDPLLEANVNTIKRAYQIPHPNDENIKKLECQLKMYHNKMWYKWFISFDEKENIETNFKIIEEL